MTVEIINLAKTVEEYDDNQSMILGPLPGLFDTIHKSHPKVWDLYKEMKSLDWDENEVDMSSCNLEFKTAPPGVAKKMIKTLAWQWEGDSTATRAIITVLAPFITSPELWAAWLRISDNEVLHAAQYSEIVRLSFDDPNVVMGEIISFQESKHRLNAVARVFNQTATLGYQYMLGLVKNDQALYNQVILAIATLFMLERIQFMASFSVTFTIADSGLFQPIAKAVQKICQDEFEVHCELGREVLRSEFKTPRGIIAKEQVIGQIREVFEEIVNSELHFVDEMFSDGEQLAGSTPMMFRKWVLFNAKDVDRFFGLECDFEYPRHNPMPNLEPWINMNKQQAANQEIDNVAYKVGVVIDDDDGEIFDF